MKDNILSNLDNPAQLERLYRSDKPAFKRAFKDIYPGLSDNTLATYWNERLNFTGGEISIGSRKDLIFVLIASFIAGIIAKLPALLSINEEFFYTRNIGFVVFPALSAYFAWKHRLSAGKIAFIIAATLAAVCFINALPDVKNNDVLLLSCMHMLLFLWSLLGFAFVGQAGNNDEKRLGFLKYNGDLVVITTLILIAGALLTGITIGLFSLIGISIEKFYFQYVVVFGVAAAPIVGTYLTRTNPHLVGRISPVLARIFSPLVLVMLVIYLIAMAYSGKDPYNDREFLLVFNGLLIGVMAIIFFSIGETSTTNKNLATVWILFLLSAVTIIVNCIALSAIIFRISELGITPNRVAVFGGNILILVNLLMVAAQFTRVISNKADVSSVGKRIAVYLPVYCLWAAFVTFIFPLIFGFK